MGHEAYVRTYFRDSAHGNATEAMNILNAPKPMAMKPITFSSLVLITATTSAQNLVPNPSFEEHTMCPDWLRQVDHTVGWEAFRLSPDYFNGCDLSDTMSVPVNLFGYQPSSDGQAYAGISNYSSTTPSTREFLGAQLTQGLTPGMPLYVSFKVAPAAFSETSYQFRWTTDRIGLRFCMNAFYQSSGPLPNSAAIALSNVLTDTLSWTIVSGIYFPDSAYQFVVLGNFYDDTLTTVGIIDSNGTYPYAYAYVDEVCVSYDPDECDLGSSTPGIDNSATIAAWPNPFADRLYIQLPRPIDVERIELLNATGQSCFFGGVAQQGQTLVLTDLLLPDGPYLLRVMTQTGALCPVLLVHVSP